SAALITIEGSGDSDRMWDATSGERSYADAPLLWQHQAWRENEPMAVLFAETVATKPGLPNSGRRPYFAVADDSNPAVAPGAILFVTWDPDRDSIRRFLTYQTSVRCFATATAVSEPGTLTLPGAGLIVFALIRKPGVQARSGPHNPRSRPAPTPRAQAPAAQSIVAAVLLSATAGG
ncbi:MAG: hypothetical protein P8102_13775, partial [Gammaproteobacteria bacterium]